MGSCVTRLPKETTITYNTNSHRTITFEPNENIVCDGSSKSDISALCTPLQRLVEALQLYGYLDFKTKNDQQNFSKYLNTVNSNILNDYNHLIDSHRHEISEICILLLESEYFIACDVSQCQYTSRHYNNTSIIEVEETLTDDKINFYKELLDSLHFFIFHTYDVGMRIHEDQAPEPTQANCEEKGYDTHFGRICGIINRQRYLSNNRKISAANKFNIKTNNQCANLNLGYNTFLDAFKAHCKNHKLNEYLELERYDTDSLQLDLNGLNGNLNEEHYGEQLAVKMHQFIKLQSCMSYINLLNTSFNI